MSESADDLESILEAKNKILEEANAAPLITSEMWQNDKENALQLATGYHFSIFMQSILDMRDENGKRPEFDMRDIVNCVYDNMQASRVLWYSHDILLYLKDVKEEEIKEKINKALEDLYLAEKFELSCFINQIKKEVEARLSLQGV